MTTRGWWGVVILLMTRRADSADGKLILDFKKLSSRLFHVREAVAALLTNKAAEQSAGDHSQLQCPPHRE